MFLFSELKKPYLIGEIGINHNGDLQIAKKLIDAVFACSWDCAKFQKKNPDRCVPENQKNMKKITPWGEVTYLEYKWKMEFGINEFQYIDMYCKEKPIDWTVSIWDLESLDFVKQFKLPFLKVPSALLTDLILLDEMCKTKLPMVISTGMSTLEEVDNAVNVCEKHATEYVVMHCNSSYPAKNEELNLKMIQVYQDRYNCIVGYSGHEYGLDSTTVAVSMGARVIERHITLDHTMWGTDHAASVEIQGMDKLYKQIENVEKIMGDGMKKIYDSELEIRKKLRGY